MKKIRIDYYNYRLKKVCKCSHSDLIYSRASYNLSSTLTIAKVSSRQ